MKTDGGGNEFRVVVDARSLDSVQPRGIGRSLQCLYREISRQRPQWRVELVHRGVTSRRVSEGMSNAREHCVRCGGDRWDLWGRVRLPLEAWRLGGNVLHLPANVGPERSEIGRASCWERV